MIYQIIVFEPDITDLSDNRIEDIEDNITVQKIYLIIV
jgi:hypothetical protein